MLSKQWESFEGLIKNCAPTVSDHGPLLGPIHSFTIRRDADLSIRMEAKSSKFALEEKHQHPPGTIRLNDDRITFQSVTGLELEAIGVSPTHTNSHLAGIEPVITTQRVEIHKLVGRLPNARNGRYVIDWLENVSKDFLWPDMVRSDSSDATKVTFGGHPTDHPQLLMKADSSVHSSAWAAAQLEVDGIRFFLCNAQEIKDTVIKRPGYIVYDADPSEEYRDRIRRCLSFSLGIYLVYLGMSRFDEEWHLTDFQAFSPYSMRGYAIELPPMPPAPLGPRTFLDIGAAQFSRMVNSIYRNYDDLSFGTVSWAYWHAIVATPHIAAVHFGAALESLQRAYLCNKFEPLMGKVIDDQTWHSMRIKLETCLDDLPLSEQVRKIFKDKIKNLNSRSQHSTGKDLVEKLDLMFSERENKAHNARHSSAHGKDDEVDIDWIRNITLLKIRFHRIFLAMTGASDEYYDYFTLGIPIRRIGEAVPDKTA